MIHINEQKEMGAASGPMNLVLQAGMIWSDLATWLRAYIISTFTELSDQEAVRKRINQIPMDFNQIFKLFFGDQAAKEYTDLFNDYIDSVESLIDAQKIGDDAAVNEYMAQIHDNIHRRAAMLSQVNQFWQESEWRALFFRYLLLTIDEANAFLAGDYVKSTEIFDTLLSVAKKMGDYFISGLNHYRSSSS